VVTPDHSTAPWDQPRNGTTITVWDSEQRTFPPGTQFHGPGHQTWRKHLGRIERGMIYLISWPNPNYRENG